MREREMIKFKKIRHVTFFVTQKSIECNLFRLYHLLNSSSYFSILFRANNVRCILYSNSYTCYTDFLRENRIIKPDLSRVIIFGNKDMLDDWPVITSLESNIITSKWFDKPLSNSIGLFFMPNGLGLLKNENWNSKFNNWITFEDKFDTLVGMPASEKIGKEIFPKIFSIAYEEDNIAHMFKRIEMVFSDTIKHISKKNNTMGSDLYLTLYKLRINKLNMRTSYNNIQNEI